MTIIFRARPSRWRSTTLANGNLVERIYARDAQRLDNGAGSWMHGLNIAPAQALR
jgi:hypothetical protein